MVLLGEVSHGDAMGKFLSYVMFREFIGALSHQRSGVSSKHQSTQL